MKNLKKSELSDLREKLGCTQEELSFLCGTSVSAIGMAESKSRFIPRDAVRAYAMIISQFNKKPSPDNRGDLFVKNEIETLRTKLKSRIKLQQMYVDRQIRIIAEIKNKRKKALEAIRTISVIEVDPKFNPPKRMRENLDALMVKQEIVLQRNSALKLWNAELKLEYLKIELQKLKAGV